MPAQYNLRLAVPDDAAAVTALLKATYPVSLAGCCDAGILAAALPLMTEAKLPLLSSGTFYLVETIDGTLVGCGGWTAAHPGTGKVAAGLAHIRHFATHPDHARRGVGRMLMTKCLEAARRSGIQQIECLATPVAEAFYRAVGFAVIGPVNVPMSLGLFFPAIQMLWTIENPQPVKVLRF